MDAWESGAIDAARAEAGTLVAAHVPHQFRDITERLVILVVFGPGEGRRA